MAASGNSTYTVANGAAFAVEKVLKRDFKLLWDTAHPLVQKLHARGRFNSGGRIEGLTFILPVQFDDLATPVNGSAAANLTPLSPAANQGDTQVSYAFSRYHGAFWLDPDELKLYMNGSRGNLMQARTSQIQQSFRKALAGDLAAASNAARANVLGLRFALSASNTVGGITQGGDNGYWNAKISTTGGTFTVAPVDEAFDLIMTEGRSKPDLLLLSHNSTVNLYGKMRDNIASMQRLVNEKRPDVNYVSFDYLGMDCVLDPDLGSALSTTGGFMMLSTDTWYWMADANDIQVEPPERLEGTGAKEYYYQIWCALGGDDMACNAYYNAFTG